MIQGIVDFVSRKSGPKKCLGDQYHLLKDHVASRVKLDPEMTWSEASPSTIRAYIREITKNKVSQLVSTIMDSL